MGYEIQSNNKHRMQFLCKKKLEIPVRDVRKCDVWTEDRLIGLRMCVCVCVYMAGSWWGCGMAHLHAPPAPSNQLRPTLPYTPILINTPGTIWFIQNTSERALQTAASIRSNLSAGSSGLMGYHTAQSSNTVNNGEASALLEKVHLALGDVKNCQHCAKS